MSGLLVLEYLLSNVPSKIPAYASVNLHEATLEVGGRGQQWAKGFAKQQQAKALHIPKGRPLASSYITKSSLLVHHMGSHDLFYLMPRGQELVQFNLGLMPRKAMVLGLRSSSPPSPIYAPPTSHTHPMNYFPSPVIIRITCTCIPSQRVQIKRRRDENISPTMPTRRIC